MSLLAAHTLGNLVPTSGAGTVVVEIGSVLVEDVERTAVAAPTGVTAILVDDDEFATVDNNSLTIEVDDGSGTAISG